MSILTRSSAAASAETLQARFSAAREFTTELCATLTAEDCCLQSMPSCSPTRWHLAHTSWFFETFLLKLDASYRVFDEHYEVLFNSYYNSVGEQFPRARRGLLSRPSLSDVLAYREHVDSQLSHWFESGRLGADAQLENADAHLCNIVEWGIQHEQQHQELILMDIKHLFSLNPQFPVYREGSVAEAGNAFGQNEWIDFDAGLREIGFDGAGFAYDNEAPRHRVYLDRFSLARAPITNGEFLEFVNQGAYRQAEYWLADGWNFVQSQSLTCPHYWFEHDGQWQEFTLAGLRPLDLSAPICHVSFYEADAYARWAGARLPTEAEWEVASEDVTLSGNFVGGLLAAGLAVHPHASLRGETPVSSAQPAKMFGDVWEWTASPYTPYPGYAPPSGALGEYNGKFMCNQYVLRGGACVTSSSHIRRTYRNFFPADARWQFAGLRLAR